jgi:hypothetical protein
MGTGLSRAEEAAEKLERRGKMGSKLVIENHHLMLADRS